MTNTTTPIRFAVIGCGTLAQSTHLPNLAKSKTAILAVCCDTSEESLSHCMKLFKPERTSTNWQETVRAKDVDAICLATTEKLRLPVIQLAAKLGKAIYVEKPLASTLVEIHNIQRVINESGIAFCVGHNRRSSPAMIEAHRIFRNHMENPKPCNWRWNREGARRPNLPESSVPSMSVRVNDDWWSWKAWVFDKTHAPHGPMLFEMTHFTDMCNWFLADEPEEVFAMENGMLSHAILIRYRHGALATIHMSANGSFGYPKELYEMSGHGGVVVVDHMLEVRTAGLADVPQRIVYPVENDHYPNVGTEGGLGGWLRKAERACFTCEMVGEPLMTNMPGVDKGHANHLARFIDQIASKGPEVCGVDATALATHIAFAAVQSATENRPVKVMEVMQD